MTDNNSYFSKTMGGARPRAPKKESQVEQSPAQVFVPEKKQSVKVKRTQRIGLVMKPDLYDAIEAQAKLAGMSKNEYCLQIIANNLRQRGLFDSTDF